MKKIILAATLLISLKSYSGHYLPHYYGYNYTASYRCNIMLYRGNYPVAPYISFSNYRLNACMTATVLCNTVSLLTNNGYCSTGSILNNYPPYHSPFYYYNYVGHVPYNNYFPHHHHGYPNPVNYQICRNIEMDLRHGVIDAIRFRMLMKRHFCW